MERKGDHQKLKMLYLREIFLRDTDDEHGLSLEQITRKLKDCGVNADRKTLYQDFEELRTYGMDIVSSKIGRTTYYNLASREFELPELKLLVDAVQSSRFITERKSKTLVKKLENLVSVHEGKQLQRQVIFSGRIKSMNESIYYNVDKLHTAISSNVQVRFKYFQWNVNKKTELRRNGELYTVSPWALIWESENYYLLAYDSEEGKIKHYRVDKMLELSLTDQAREGKNAIQGDMPQYTLSLFGMFGGEQVFVTLEAENSLVGVFIDRFGKDIPIMPAGDSRFRTIVKVSVSGPFLGWVMGLGNQVRIISPDLVVDRMRTAISQLDELYR